MELEALTSFVEEIFKLPLSVPWSVVSIGEDHMLAGLDLRCGSETMCLADFSRTALWTLSALPNTGQAGKSRTGNAYAGRQSLYECTQAIYSRSKLEKPAARRRHVNVCPGSSKLVKGQVCGARIMVSCTFQVLCFSCFHFHHYVATASRRGFLKSKNLHHFEDYHFGTE